MNTNDGINCGRIDRDENFYLRLEPQKKSQDENNCKEVANLYFT
jgi:hypothetical protein